MSNKNFYYIKIIKLLQKTKNQNLTTIINLHTRLQYLITQQPYSNQHTSLMKTRFNAYD